jgi:hypothetical protein
MPNLTEPPSTVVPLPRKFDVEELARVFPKSYGTRIPDTHHQWWIDFAQNLRKRIEVKRF